MAAAANKPKRSMARLVLPVAAGGLLVAGVGLVIRARQQPHTVSKVIEDIRAIVLKDPEGGALGPWWVSASEQDPLTGEFKDFNLESGATRIAAKAARLTVDPDTDTFSFELWDLVLTRVPDKKDQGQRPDPSLIQMDHHILGPAPYGADITPDGA